MFISEKQKSGKTDGWSYVDVKCKCGYAWVAVYPSTCDKLECKNCGDWVEI